MVRTISLMLLCDAYELLTLSLSTLFHCAVTCTLVSMQATRLFGYNLLHTIIILYIANHSRWKSFSYHESVSNRKTFPMK